MSSTAILKTCFDVMHFTGASHVLRPYFSGMGVIFCLHHVCPGGGLQRWFAPNARLEITPEFLGEIIELVQARGYDLVSLGEATVRLKFGNAGKRPFAAFTLDDGYKDNLVHAMPVFRRHKCPFTVFVSPRIADGTCELWWRALEALIAQSNQIDLELAGSKYMLETREDGQKRVAWNKLAPALQALPEFDQREWISQTCSQHGIDLNAMCRAVAMTWDEIRIMNSDPLATIGAHTLNHYNLAKLSGADAKREILESGKRIEAELGEPTKHFAYPYGNTDAAQRREFKLCAELGYESSVTTRLGGVFPIHADHMQALPRIMVSGRFQKARYIEALMSGVPGVMMNRFRRVNVA